MQMQLVDQTGDVDLTGRRDIVFLEVYARYVDDCHDGQSDIVIGRKSVEFVMIGC